MTKFYDKKFLNQNGFHSIAAMGYGVTITDYDSIDGEIQVSDCNKTIYIDLSDSFTENTKREERENNLRKISVMIQVLEDCKRDYITACEEVKEIEDNKEDVVESALESEKSINGLLNKWRNRWKRSND